jgi:putative hydrolase of the HAD superfamily
VSGGGIKPSAVRAVFFDAGGTILRVNPSVEVVYAEAAARHGFPVERASLRSAFAAAWKRSLERGRARGHRATDEILRSEWFEIVRETFGAAVPATGIGPLFADLYERFISANAWTLVPGIRETFAHLRERGVRLGILSNWDSRFRRMLADLELAGEFEHVVVSHEVGFEKPHDAIFTEALRQAGTPAGATLHVGDSFEADIEPAARLGMRTLWVTPRAAAESRAYAGPWVESLPAKPRPFWDEVLGVS